MKIQRIRMILFFLSVVFLMITYGTLIQFYLNLHPIKVLTAASKWISNGSVRGLSNSHTENLNKEMELCPHLPPNLVGHIDVDTNSSVTTEDDLEKLFTWIKPGGRYSPEDCKARHHVAIVIPFRNRYAQLKTLLYNILPMMKRQQLDYGVFVINQENGTLFNKAMLFNSGYIEISKNFSYTCFIFHDVDLIPEDDRNIYRCTDNPHHLAVAIDKFEYSLLYRNMFGGVTAMDTTQMEKLNGYSNKFYGWGGEDDDMWNRIHRYNMTVTRPSGDIARYKMLKHERDVGNPENKERHKIMKINSQNYTEDGISNARYDIKEVKVHKLYTFISILIP